MVRSLWLKNKGEKMLYMATAYGEGDGAYEETERGVILVPQTTVASTNGSGKVPVQMYLIDVLVRQWLNLHAVSISCLILSIFYHLLA